MDPVSEEKISLDAHVDSFFKNAPKEASPIDVWQVLDLYFRDRGLVYHKLEPYDLAIETMKNVIRHAKPIMIEDRKSLSMYQYTFSNVSVIKPSFLPQEARLRKLDYNLTITADIIQGYTTGGKTVQKFLPNQKIAEIPLMLKSKWCRLHGLNEKQMIEAGECEYDIGGYYIVNGKERCIVAQERIEYNRIYVWPPQKVDEKKAYALVSQVSSVIVRGSKPAIVKVFIEPSKNTVCTVSGLKEEIQVGTILHALGSLCGLWKLTDDSSDRIRKMICNDPEDYEMNELIDVILHNSNLSRKGKTLEIIGSVLNGSIAHAERVKAVSQLLGDEILTHVGKKKRVHFLAYMIRKLFLVFLKRRKSDDRDHFANKRCDTDGKLLEDLFRGFFDKYIENITTKLSSHPTNISIFERDTTITIGIHRCMSTGKWGIQKIGFQKKGVSQLLTRLNYISAISHLLRASSNRSKESRSMRLRQLHNSQWGIFDPAESPEGEMAGIIKNMAICAHITSSTSDSVILNLIKEKVPEFLDEYDDDFATTPKIFLNGALIGMTQVPGMVIARLRDFRMKGMLHHDTSISYKSIDKELHIYCDDGRCSRPLFVVEKEGLVVRRFLGDDGKLTPGDWHDMISKGAIQYVDTNEEQTCEISTYANNLLSKSDYCEIHPATILGISSSIIPFIANNQSPRNCYSGSMTKQAMGIFVSNFLQRFDTSAYILWHAQKPIVAPRMSHYFSYHKLPSGLNCTVAIIMDEGYGQEDSVILNQGAVDRGLFTVIYSKTYSCVEKNQENQIIETIEPPFDAKSIDRSKNYLKLDDEGIIKEKSIVRENDVIICKSTRRSGKNSERMDSSVVHKLEEVGFVDQVLISKNAEGNRQVDVKVSFVRIPLMGDKFASVHAQKGTCGRICPTIDMPFTENGIIPDILVNPCAIPSRMTIAHLIECITGKVGALEGKFMDATPFWDNEKFMMNHISQLKSALNKHKFHGRGEETMYSGITGKKLTGTVFVGPTYYRRLKHMITDKLSARADGPYQFYTRQSANHGRKNGRKYTSIRFGEMEADAMASYGASQSIRERLLISADNYKTPVCHRCGMLSVAECKCGAGSSETVMPYVFKLTHQNITALQIKMSITTESSSSIEDMMGKDG